MEQLPQLQWVITKANADAGGQEINQRIDEWCAGQTNAKAFTSLGVVRYLSAMKQAAVVWKLFLRCGGNPYLWDTHCQHWR